MLRSTRTRRGGLALTVLMEASVRGPCPGDVPASPGRFAGAPAYCARSRRDGVRLDEPAMSDEASRAPPSTPWLEAAPCVKPLGAKPRLAALGVLAELDLARRHCLVEGVERAAGVGGRGLGVHPAGRCRVARG